MAVDSMSVGLVNSNKEIEMYDWKEVTSHRVFVSNTTMLDPDGLYSEEIFGKQGTPERKTKWGYISLNSTFMNPHAFYVFSRLKRVIATNIKMGIGRYYVDKDGELQPIDITKEKVPTTALVQEPGTGFEWLASVWDKISWKTTKQMSSMAKTFRNFLKSRDKDEIFYDKFLVMPAFYRDIDPKSNKRNKINTYYSKILRLGQIIKSSSNLIFVDDPNTPCVSSSHIKMQDALTEIYTYFIEKVSGSHGFASENVLGKRTDYGARLVISPPDFNTNHYKDCEANFFKSSVPLSVVINIFSPFIVYGMTQFIQQYVSGQNFITYFDVNKVKFVQAELDPTYMSEFTPEKIRKYIDRYKNSKTYRLNPVTLKGVNGTRIPIVYYFNDVNDLKTDNMSFIEAYEPEKMLSHVRYMTWCELFYIIAVDNCNDKPIHNTRYPLTTYNNTYASFMNIIPANKYKCRSFNGVKYERFPLLEAFNEHDIDALFTDTMRMCSVYLDAMGADYDGDQISTQGLFTNEAIKEADEHIKSISNIIGVNNDSVRGFPHVVKHGMYGLTYKTSKGESK